ncbi:MAG: hypothetical protein ACFCUQ_10090 [Kiloniellales bacterium]
MVAAPIPGGLGILDGLPSFATSSAAMSQSGPIYATMNSPFSVGGSRGGVAGQSLSTLSAMAPWIVAGVVAWAVLRR